MNTTYSKSPFCLAPIKVLAQFFGREKETRQALGFLHWGQCVSVVGPAKIGKTSFLSHVAHPYVRAQHRLAEEQIFVHLDSHPLNNLDQGECFLCIREEVLRQVKSTVSVDKVVGVQLEKAVREAGRETAYFGLNTLFRTAQANDLKLIIILDNFESLAQSPCLENEFFSALRSLPMKFQMAYLVTSQFPLDTLERVRPEASPFFNIFQPIILGPFTPEESRAFICTLLKQVYVEFPEFAIEHILELGSNEPHRLQRAGYIAFQMWQENQGNLCVEHCEEIRQRFEKMET